MLTSVKEHACNLAYNIFDGVVVLILLFCYYEYVQKYGERNLKDKYMKRRRFNKDHFEDVNPVKIHGKRLLAKLGEIYHTYLSRLMASMNSDS